MLYSDPNYSTDYRGFQIALKRDFGKHGYLIDGHKVFHGYNVLKDGANIMPGATWFLTVKQAQGAIDDLLNSGARRIGDEHEFWARTRLRAATSDRGLDLYRAVLDHLERTYDATGGAQGPLRALLAEIENAVDTRDTVQEPTGGKRRVGSVPERITEILNEKA